MQARDSDERQSNKCKFRKGRNQGKFSCTDNFKIEVSDQMSLIPFNREEDKIRIMGN